MAGFTEGTIELSTSLLFIELLEFSYQWPPAASLNDIGRVIAIILLCLLSTSVLQLRPRGKQIIVALR